MCTLDSPCVDAGVLKKRRVHIAELIKLLKPELPSHIFEQVKAELEQLI